MTTIKQQVSELNQQGLKAKQIMEQLTEQNIKVKMNTIRWYLSKLNKKE